MASNRKFDIKETEKGTELMQYWGKDDKVIIPDGITHIGEGAFAYHKELTEVVIPLGVSEVGMSAFYDCEKLKKVTLSNKTKIGEFAFFGCPPDIAYDYYED